jgi:BlaI family transcriptional regulator, penicillinase repressor
MKELTKAEEQIMQAVWQIKKGFLKDIIDALPEPKPAYNTVLTVCRILVQKEFLNYKEYGKSFEYAPTITKENYSKQRLQALKKRFFNNSNKHLLSFFIKENNISLEDLNDIVKELKK